MNRAPKWILYLTYGLIAALVPICIASHQAAQRAQSRLVVWAPESIQAGPLIAALKMPGNPALVLHTFSYGELYRRALRVVERKTLSGDGRPFDVLLADDPWLPALRSGLADDLPPPATGLYPDNVLAIARDGSKYFAYPYSGNVQMLCYNRTLYPDGNTLDTWDRWKDAIVGATDRAQKLHMAPAAIRALDENAIVTDFVPMLWACNKEASVPEADYNLGLLGDNPVRAANMLLEIGRHAPTGYLYFDDSDIAESLWQRAAGVGVVWTAWAMLMNERQEAGARSAWRELEFREMPDSQTEMGVWALCVRKDTARAADAKRLVQSLTSFCASLRAARFGVPPVRHDVFQALGCSGGRDGICHFLQVEEASLATARPRPRNPRWRDIEAVIGRALTDVHKSIAPELVMRDADACIRRINASADGLAACDWPSEKIPEPDSAAQVLAGRPATRHDSPRVAGKRERPRQSRPAHSPV